MIDEVMKGKIKKLYSSYAFTKDETADAMEAVNLEIKSMAKELEIKPKILTKFLANKYIKEQKGIDEIFEVSQLSCEIEDPNSVDEEEG